MSAPVTSIPLSFQSAPFICAHSANVYREYLHAAYRRRRSLSRLIYQLHQKDTPSGAGQRIHRYALIRRQPDFGRQRGLLCHSFIFKSIRRVRDNLQKTPAPGTRGYGWRVAWAEWGPVGESTALDGKAGGETGLKFGDCKLFELTPFRFEDLQTGPHGDERRPFASLSNVERRTSQYPGSTENRRPGALQDLLLMVTHSLPNTREFVRLLCL